MSEMSMTPRNQDEDAGHSGESWKDNATSRRQDRTIRATIIVGDDIEGYDLDLDLDLYEYFPSDDQGDRERSHSG
jgi:hypothetical protein